jgi:hypothetical protein
MRYYQINERTEENISQDEVNRVPNMIHMLITTHRRVNIQAADIYHDAIMKGTDVWFKWIEENIFPIWKELGYPEISSPGWGELERLVKERILKI